MFRSTWLCLRVSLQACYFNLLFFYDFPSIQAVWEWEILQRVSQPLNILEYSFLPWPVGDRRLDCLNRLNRAKRLVHYLRRLAGFVAKIDRRIIREARDE
ncbi:uncharacterized protein GGS22DRAFT_166385 [Annulohypoxylon maeteangense]|uniref:uncharacterized protein n=1 Tax=Annulohypoxylon maeteangense TaxID=1927788 RepID=UPI0020072D14|nr:uncharacterized protein GGS22DRAFT_166385 [Annulohypoxylon maeteangense]KAI0883913.1 hypothetical protein GGS22DRAFT_166385 [Annulohypoxylon maeteangense]